MKTQYYFDLHILNGRIVSKTQLFFRFCFLNINNLFIVYGISHASTTLLNFTRLPNNIRKRIRLGVTNFLHLRSFDTYCVCIIDVI